MLGTLLPLVVSSMANGQAAQIARGGSPLLVSAAGRLLGLGEGERSDLAGGRIPWWVWTTGGLAAGVLLGAWLHKKYPDKLPGFMGGE